MKTPTQNPKSDVRCPKENRNPNPEAKRPAEGGNSDFGVRASSRRALRLSQRVGFRPSVLGFLLLLLSTLNLPLSTLAQGTAFTYQGRLNDGANPANGNYDLTFAIFGVASGGTAVAGPLTNSFAGVSNGLFTVLLDFGLAVFNGNSRWLEIAVRPTGGGTFNTLAPRQPITAAPYAIFAGNAGAGGGSPWSLNGTNTFYNAGNVGIGTTSFGSLLTVGSISKRGTLNVVGSITAPPAISLTDPRFIGNGNQYSIYAGLNFLGSLDIFDQFSSVSRLTIISGGNVGIGTNVPQAKLHVRGDIRLGANGEFQATSGEENLRIVRGVVHSDGSLITGAGFTVSHSANGQYSISFNTAFAGAPSVTATCDSDGGAINCFAQTEGVTASSAGIRVRLTSTGADFNAIFHFIAIGPR